MEKTDVNKIGMFGLLTVIAVATTGVATMSSFIVSAEAAPDRCFSGVVNGFPVSSCSHSKEEAQTLKEQCRDAKKTGGMEKCSSSQTTFGESGNWQKK